MPRAERSKPKDLNQIYGKDDVWKGTPSRACMLLWEQMHHEAVPAQRKEDKNDRRSDSEKIGDIRSDPKEKLMHYEKALAECENAAKTLATESGRMFAVESALRVKGKIGNAHEGVVDALVKRAQKASRKEARRLYDRALEVCDEAMEMHSKCRDLEGVQRVEGRINTIQALIDTL